MSGDDPAHGASPCDAIEKWTAYYGGSAMYKSLVNLDPANATYQPWPLERIDATYDGAAGWNNTNSQLYVQAGYTPPNGIPNWAIYSNIDRNKVFNAAWPNDHRHFLQKFFDYDYFPIDVCDDFKRFQHALMVDFNHDARPMGFESAPGGNYLNNDIIFYTSLGVNGMIGPGIGKIEPGYDIGGIDVWQTSYWVARMFILEHGADWAVEVYDISNTAAGWGLDAIAWKFQIPLPDSVEPLDCELLPTNSHFIHNKNNPTLCVLVANVVGGGGNVYFYDASNGNLLGHLGNLGTGMPSPPIQHDPQHIDNDDGHYEIHVISKTAAGPVVDVIEWI
jgi:hypothetical protein